MIPFNKQAGGNKRRVWMLISAVLLVLLLWQAFRSPTPEEEQANALNTAKFKKLLDEVVAMAKKQQDLEKKQKEGAAIAASSGGGGGGVLVDDVLAKSLPDSEAWVPIGDSPILKKVLVVGRAGGALPTIGATLEVHYTGTLASNGKKFDSSRDRGSPFVFTLGKGSVIKCWEMGIASMQFGEKAILRCPPRYAYGSGGHPPAIPGDATLDFDVELMPQGAPLAEGDGAEGRRLGGRHPRRPGMLF